MNIAVFYYDGFCEFEIVLTMLDSRIHAKHNLTTFALEDREYKSIEKQRFLPDTILAALHPEEIDLLIIPGGEPELLFENRALKDFVWALHRKKKNIAAICGGTELLAKFEILNGLKCTGEADGLFPEHKSFKLFKQAIIQNEGVVKDEHIITATGQYFIEFSLEVGKLLEIYSSPEEAEGVYKWFKNCKKL